MRKVLGIVLVCSACIAGSLAGLAQSEDAEKKIEAIAGLIRESNFDDAVKQSAEFMAANPFSYDAHMLAFQAYLGASKKSAEDFVASTRFLDKALKHLNIAHRLNPDSYEAWEAAIAFWDSARLNPLPRDPEAEKILNQAQQYFSEGELDKAVELLEKVVNLEPTYAPAYLHLGEVYLTREEPEKALKFLKIATDKDPADSTAFLLLATAFGKLEKGAEAIDNLLQSLKADPGFPVAWQQLESLELAGKKVTRIAPLFPKSVLWAVERDIRDPGEKDLEGVAPATQSAWKAYVNTRVLWRRSEFAKRNPTLKAYRYSYGEESAAINDLVKAWKESKKEHPEFADPLLDHWLAASDAGALDSAIFAELFSEEFRQEFNAWKRQNPNKFDEYFFRYVLGQVVEGQKK